MSNEWLQIDKLIEMAKKDPEKLEELRLNEINRLIESAPENLQRRLRGLQFQIDCKREIHKSSMGCCITISKMMHESVDKLNSALNGFASTEFSNSPSSDHAAESAQIIAFPVTA